MNVAPVVHYNAQTYYVAVESVEFNELNHPVAPLAAATAPIPRASRFSVSSSPWQVERMVTLLGSIAPGWVLRQELWITIEQDDDGSWLASDDFFAIYGEGYSPREALDDYILSLIDYYELLRARREDNPAARVMFERLRAWFVPSLPLH